MVSYFIDVLISLSSYIAVFFILLLVLPLLFGMAHRRSWLDDKKHKFLTDTSKLAAWLLIGLGFLLSLLSPTNTYKHEPYERQTFSVPMERTDAIIQDITRQPKQTDEERKEHFDNLTNSWKDK